MAEIIIKRDGGYTDAARDYNIHVDGEKVATISRDSEKKITVQPGKHTIQLKIDWCCSAELEIAADHSKPVRLKCGANSNPLLALLYISIWRKKYLSLQQA